MYMSVHVSTCMLVCVQQYNKEAIRAKYCELNILNKNVVSGVFGNFL